MSKTKKETPPAAPKDVRVEKGVVHISTDIPVGFGGGS